VREKFAHKEKKMAKNTWLRGAALVLIAALSLAGCNKKAEAQEGGSSGGTAKATASKIKEAPASDFSYELTADKKGIVIKRYTGKDAFTGGDGKVAIPATIEDIPVTEIGKEAFINADLTEIVIPASVTKIGFQAFYGCKLLTTVNLPTGLESIEAMAFCVCYELNNLVIPDSLSIKFYTGGKESPANRAFEGCSKLPLATRSKIEALGYTGKF
jgi:hypothetical protein